MNKTFLHILMYEVEICGVGAHFEKMALKNALLLASADPNR